MEAGRFVSARALRAVQQPAIALTFVGVAVMTRGAFLNSTTMFNPDEAELMAQARAALRSPVPFTTWTTATTGPFWVYFLALLGWVGLPLTIAFAHLLSAVMFGVLGYLGFTLARRSLGAATGVVVTGFWWLPMVLSLSGPYVDYAALVTELLPGVLVLGASLLRIEALGRRPALYYPLAGLVCGLAVGSKYQVAPMILAVFAVQAILVGDYTRRHLVRAAAYWVGGLLAPFLLLGLVMLVSSDVSTVAIGQDLNFLSSYSGGLTFTDKVQRWRGLVAQMPLVLLVLAVCWLGVRSSRRVQLCRTILVLSGLLAVYIGGMGFPHYQILAYLMLMAAIALPMEPGSVLIARVGNPLATAGVIALVAVVGWVTSFGPSVGFAKRTGLHELSTSLSASTVKRAPALAASCPAGSNVVVWGWASELYINYSWQNAIPFMNVTQLTSSPKNYASGYTLMHDAIADPTTKCVVDAVGAPFFAPADLLSLTREYPSLIDLLNRQYTAVNDIKCPACSVYVRR